MTRPRKPLLYFANGRWNCSVRLAPGVVIGHGTTPALAYRDMAGAILNDAKMLMSWVCTRPLSLLEFNHA